MDCIFCSIVEKKLPATVVYEDEQIVVFPDIHPKANVHLLIVPKAHIASLEQTSAQESALLGELLTVTAKIARTQGVAERGYKVIINTGVHGGQIIPHLHLHLLGGEPIRTMV